MVEFMDRRQIDAQFEQFEHTLFRLETRDTYLVDHEQERFHRFLAGEREGDDSPARFSEFKMLIRRQVAEGKRAERVRVVTEPHTDYTRWLLYTTRHNIAAGEDIRYLPRSQADELDLPHEDYWLFDSREAQRFHFEDDGRVKGRELVLDPTLLVRYNLWRDAAWHYATRWSEYAERHGLR